MGGGWDRQKRTITEPALRRIAKLADGWFTHLPPNEDGRAGMETFRRFVREAGRDPLRFSLMIGCVVARDESELRVRLAQFKDISGQDEPPISGTVDQVVAKLREYEQVGVERVMLQHLVHEDVEMVNVLGDVAARLG